MPASRKLTTRHPDKRSEATPLPGKLSLALGHEIKNILAGISASLQVLEEQMPETDPQKQIMQEIVLQVARLDTAVKTLMKEKGLI